MTGPITLMTVGSRGDVQPFVALALELLRRGYGVRLAAPAEARPLVEELGVPFFPLEAHYTDLAQSERGQAAIAGHWREVASLLAEVREQTRALLDSAQRAAQGSRALVFHPKALAGRHLAEALGVPAWLMLPAPLLLPTREFAAPATVAEAGPLNPLTYLPLRLAEGPLRSVVGAWRQELGLTDRTYRLDPRYAGGRLLPILHAYSRQLVPVPRDWHWSAGAPVTGFWRLPGSAEPELSAELQRFLEAGPAPVVFGFGSMGPGESPQGLVSLAHSVLRRLEEGVGQAGRKWRGVVLGVPGHLSTEQVFAAPAAPHGRLFARACASVHHGGAGTVAAAVHAGLPSVAVPHGMDQPFWARQLERLDVGRSVPRRQLSAAALAQALSAVMALPTVQRAHTLGTLLELECGVEVAADRIQFALSR
ncbi:glycosyltransferase [Deinococcus piscis]|nr:glycosyltransferase [Deinococcus piscis]